MEKEFENLEKRVEKLERIFDIINNLTLQIEKLAIETKYSRENKVINRVDVLEHKPEKRYDSMVTTAITGVVGAIIGAIMSLIIRL